MTAMGHAWPEGRASESIAVVVAGKSLMTSSLWAYNSSVNAIARTVEAKRHAVLCGVSPKSKISINSCSVS